MLRIDLHSHSVASGHAVNTIYELAKTASEKGMEMIAITDHGPNYKGSAPDFFTITPRIPRKLHNVELLLGCEANILDTKGRLDLSEELLKRQDIVLAGLHHRTGYKGSSVENHTEAIIGAMENPHVHIIAHPYIYGFPTNVEKVVKAASEKDVALEINCHILKYHGTQDSTIEKTKELIKDAIEQGVKLVISSDAHVASELGDDSVLDELRLKPLIKEGSFLNTSTRSVRFFLKSKKQRINLAREDVP